MCRQLIAGRGSCELPFRARTDTRFLGTKETFFCSDGARIEVIFQDKSFASFVR